MRDNNKNLNIVDPETGAPLIPKGNNLYFSEYTGVYCRINKDGRIAAIRDPETGAPLIPKPDGTYYSEYLKGSFIYDEKRENYIPLFIMDLTGEPAHIEGDFLVGNDSNRRFPILPHGKVLLPLHETKPLKTLEEFLAEKNRLFNQPQSEINKLLNIQFFNYKSEILDKIDKKTMEERKALKEKLESEIQDMQDKTNEKMEQRRNILNFIMDLYVKMTRDEYISSEEIETLNEYKKEGLLPKEIDEINSYYNSTLSNVLEEGRKL